MSDYDRESSENPPSLSEIKEPLTKLLVGVLRAEVELKTLVIRVDNQDQRLAALEAALADSQATAKERAQQTRRSLRDLRDASPTPKTREEIEQLRHQLEKLRSTAFSAIHRLRVDANPPPPAAAPSLPLGDGRLQVSVSQRSDSFELVLRQSRRRSTSPG